MAELVTNVGTLLGSDQGGVYVMYDMTAGPGILST